MVFPQNVTEQTELCILNIKTILEQCDLELSDVIKTTVWLTKIEYFQEFNNVYEKYFRVVHHVGPLFILMIPTA